MLARKFQIGGSTEPILQYVFDKPEDLQKQVDQHKVCTVTDKGKTRCLGAAIDISGKFGYPYRDVLYKNKKSRGPEVVIGDNDNVVDSWNMLDAGYRTEDLEVLYDRERDGELTDEMIANIPVYALIGTGDARGHFVSPDNPKRLSRHTVVSLGYDKTGAPLIYDMGKVKSNLLETKYKGEVNFIIAPKSKRIYYKDPNPTKEVVADTTAPVTQSMSEQPITMMSTTPIIQEELPDLEESNVAQTYAELINRSRYQRQQLRQRRQQELT